MQAATPRASIRAIRAGTFRRVAPFSPIATGDTATGERNMLAKIMTASVLAIGLATAAMAQTAGSGNGTGDNMNSQSDTTGSGKQLVDPTGTNSTNAGQAGDMNSQNSNADKNCANTPQGAQGATSNMAGANVNDNNCGK
jgi:hypothetical protein